MEKHEIAYLAGLFDGEGFIGIVSRGKNGRKKPNIEIKMSCETTIKYVAEKLNTSYLLKPKERPHWKDQWRVRFTYRRAETVVTLLLPYLVTKKDAAKKMLAFYE